MGSQNYTYRIFTAAIFFELMYWLKASEKCCTSCDFVIYFVQWFSTWQCLSNLLTFLSPCQMLVTSTMSVQTRLLVVILQLISNELNCQNTKIINVFQLLQASQVITTEDDKAKWLMTDCLDIGLTHNLENCNQTH